MEIRRAKDSLASPGAVGPWQRPYWSPDMPAALRPSRSEAEAAVSTLIAYIGDDLNCEGVIDTAERVIMRSKSTQAIATPQPTRLIVRSRRPQAMTILC